MDVSLAPVAVRSGFRFTAEAFWEAPGLGEPNLWSSALLSEDFLSALTSPGWELPSWECPSQPQMR